MTTPEIDAAQAHADEAWGAHGAIRGPLRDQLHKLVADIEGVTGLPPSPGAEALVDRFLDFAEFNATALANAAEHRGHAMVAQAERDQLIAAQPEAEPTPAPAMLSEASDVEVRAWLLEANPNDVRDALNEVLDTAQQQEWAQKLMGWARADGNTAQTFAAINSVIVASNPAEIPDHGPTGGTTESHDPNVVAPDATVVEPTPEPEAPVDAVLADDGAPDTAPGPDAEPTS